MVKSCKPTLYQQCSILLLALAGITTAALGSTLDMNVNCSNGESVNDALAGLSDQSTPVSITITGTCGETVNINRDDVTLTGATPADGIEPPEGGDGVKVSDGAVRVMLNAMTISNAQFGISDGSRSMVMASGLTIEGGLIGIVAADGAYLRLKDSHLNGPGTGTQGATGILTSTGGTSTVIDSTIEGYDVGILASGNGTVFIGPTPYDDYVPTTIQNNNYGLNEENGSSVQISNAVIQNNVKNGITVFPNSSFLVNYGNDLQILNNGDHGISLYKNSSVKMVNANLTIQGNGGNAVYCHSDAALVVTLSSANISGGIHNCSNN